MSVITPSIPMLGGKGNGKVLLVIGVLVALAMAAKAKQTATTSNTAS
jgi:hypothetical protein